MWIICSGSNIDGGRVIYLVDTGKIQSLKFPTFWFEATPQGKFMLSVAFGQAKYYTDNLRENILRGIGKKYAVVNCRQKPRSDILMSHDFARLSRIEKLSAK